MSDQSISTIRPLAPGIIFALLSIALGFVLGGAFGAAEDSIKSRLQSSAESVLDTVYNGESDQSEAVVRRSWGYMKRAHLHGSAIGTAALTSILLLALLGKPGIVEKITATAFGFGSFLYSSFWLVAGLLAPSMGGTGEAKEALAFMAVPGAAFCLLGIFGTIFSVVKRLADPGNPR